jgi:phosphonate transport system substrate-binding protein
MNKIKNILLTILAFVQVIESNTLFGSDATVYTFSVVPQQSATILARLWTPLLEDLSEETGVQFRFTTAKNIPVFEQRLLAGEYDFAYMNPYHYTEFSLSPGYIAFAKEKDKQIRGIVVVHKDSAVETFEDLAGKELAFPSPAAFAASILPRAHLRNNGWDILPQYVSSHDSVYRNVVKGIYPAGGGIMRTFSAIDSDISDQLRILWTSEGYTPHAFTAHPRVDKELVKKLLDALLAFNESEIGRSHLERLNFKSIEAACDDDWDDVRSLNINLLDSSNE